MAASTLVLEALVVSFAGLVARDIERVPAATALGVCGALSVACLLAAGLLRSRAGYGLGWVLQAALVAVGYWVPSMYFLGALFALLLVTALRQGARIERERAQIAGGAVPPGEDAG
jgi:hypothetical protein